jgi:hypothetical protein
MKATEAKFLEFLKKGTQFVIPIYLWVPKTSSAGWIDAKRAVERQPY